LIEDVVKAHAKSLHPAQSGLLRYSEEEVREAIKFYNRVVVDGRYISLLEADPKAAAFLLRIDVPERTFEILREARRQTELIFDLPYVFPPLFVPAVIAGCIIGIAVAIVINGGGGGGGGGDGGDGGGGDGGGGGGDGGGGGGDGGGGGGDGGDGDGGGDGGGPVRFTATAADRRVHRQSEVTVVFVDRSGQIKL
jgi:preprotein translocase subunit Sec61beta